MNVLACQIRLIWCTLMAVLTLDLISSHVKGTFGHTPKPAFSVHSELLCYFPGHADAFQTLYGVYPILSWFSRLSLCTTYIPVYSLSWQSVVVIRRTFPSHLCILYECARAISVFSLLWWDLSSPVVSAPWPSRYWLCLSMRCPSFFFGTCDVWLLAFSFVQLLEAIMSW